MPHSQYVAGREPPSIWDRLLANPFVILFSIMAVIIGVQIICSIFVPDFVVSRAVHNAHPLAQVGMAMPLLAGGIISGTAAINPKYRLGRVKAWVAERFGNIILGSGWLAFSFAVLFSGNQFGIFTGEVLITLGAAFWVRAAACWVSERRVRAQADVEQRMKR